jgi:hypothetical protein
MTSYPGAQLTAGVGHKLSVAFHAGINPEGAVQRARYLDVRGGGLDDAIPAADTQNDVRVLSPLPENMITASTPCLKDACRFGSQSIFLIIF